MKILAAIATVLIAASHLSAESLPASTATEPNSPAGGTAVKKVAPPKPAPEPVINGTVIPRGDGTFLGLEAVGGDFKLSFYDKKKKPVAPNVTRATARWPNKRGPGDLRAVLNLSGNALVSATNRVDPPFTYRVYLTLLSGEGEEAKVVESFVVQFHG